MAIVDLREITEKVAGIFMREGVDKETAELTASVLADTEIKGIKTHGFLRVPMYVQCLSSGGIKPNGNIDILAETPTMARVSGHGGMGIPIAVNATKLAIKKAKETGVGIVTVCGSHHLGATGYYADMCAKEGMIGICMSNGNAMIAPTGGAAPAIGNNPFSYAVPAGKYGTVLYDIAMSMGSDMKILAMCKNGERVPDGWFIDKNGYPSNDPEAFRDKGVLLPFGGYKGYGLAIMVEMLAATLSGAAMTKAASAWNKIPSEEGGNVGHFIMAIDISKITDPEEFTARAEELIKSLSETRLAPGADKIYYPGEKEKINKETSLASGKVEVNDEVLAKIEALL